MRRLTRQRGKRHPRPAGQHRKPYVVITSHNPALTLGEGVKVRYATLLEAANCFAQATAPCKTVIFDDGHAARELTEQEEHLLEGVCHKLGFEIDTLDG